MKVQLYILLISLSIFWITSIEAAFKPCLGKAFLGEDCDFDDDCGTYGSYCHPTGRCQCHPGYDQYNTTNSKTGQVTYNCQKLPDKFGQECDQKCAEPLYCENGQCGCKYTARKGDTCVLDNGVGQRCTKHTDCTKPFTACVNSKCACISGTYRSGANCIGTNKCPQGGAPGRKCIRYGSDLGVFENVAGSKDAKMDSCGPTEFCVTADGSTSGHCCKMTCPLRTDPTTKYSCDGPASNCPSETHFCHKVSGTNYAYAVCCKRPCQSAGPEGQYDYRTQDCRPRGFLDGECRDHRDCDGEGTMECQRKKCVCKDNFVPKRDRLTSVLANPPQTCERQCSNDGAKDTKCFSTMSSLGRACFIQQQCPAGSTCWRGRCECNCGYEVKFGRCVMPTTTPPPTTQAPRRPVGGAAGGSTGGAGGLPSLPGLGGGGTNPLGGIFGDFDIGSFINGATGGGATGGSGAAAGGAGGLGELFGRFFPGGLSGAGGKKR